MPASTMNELETTTDAFLKGAIEVVQPVRGHRSGLDALLLAASVPGGAEGRLADFGAGTGVVGMAVACRCRNLTADLIERDASLTNLARRSLVLPVNGCFAARVTPVEADIATSAAVRREAGLEDESYNWVVANPPFNDLTHRASPDEGKAAAHMMDGDMLDRWLRSMAATAAPRGELRLILRPGNLAVLLSAAAGRFGNVRIKPVYGQPGEPAYRILVGGLKGSRAPLQILEPFQVHEVGGGFTPHAEAVFSGEAVIEMAGSDG